VSIIPLYTDKGYGSTLAKQSSSGIRESIPVDAHGHISCRGAREHLKEPGIRHTESGKEAWESRPFSDIDNTKRCSCFGQAG
jgi:hypothetical protein